MTSTAARGRECRAVAIRVAALTIRPTCRQDSNVALTYVDRGTSGTQLDIISGTAVVGKLWKAVLSRMADQDARWAWTWYAGPASGPQKHGIADNVDDAKAEIEQQWRLWLEHAGLVER